MSRELRNETSCNSECNCDGGISRRDLLRWTGAGTLAWGLSQWPAMAGPFDASDFEKLVPADKKLSPDWVKSLFERGTPTVYRDNELDLIGMPVGGICAGQLYLGGDGRLWHWDIFNLRIGTGSEHYASPLRPASPLDQGFAVRVNRTVRPLDRRGFADVRFRGEYPIAQVEYRDPELPVTVTLEAFSPFIPLNEEDSSLPATVMRFTVKNTSESTAEVELAGWLENAVCLYTAKPDAGVRRNRVARTPSAVRLDCSATEPKQPTPKPVRADVVFENWDRDTYESWSVAGTAFGTGPILKSKIPEYQGDVGGPGKRVANSHATAPGRDVGEKDNQTGSLTSRSFTIERNYIKFWVGGGNHAGNTCLNLLVDDQVADTVTGPNNNRMRIADFDVRHLQGKQARLQIVDSQAGPWGNIGVGEIVFSDKPAEVEGKFEERHDFGTMVLALLDPQPDDRGVASLPNDTIPAGLFSSSPENDDVEDPFGRPLRGGLARKQKLAPGEEATVTFLIAWHFPNDRIDGVRDTGRYYAVRFKNAAEVADYVARNFTSLHQQTRLWRDTWYESTLPYWFLDRTFLNTSILATSTCHRFASGRFYGWEGVGCCAGTCTHVWQYAQAVARLFPSLERDLRERTDFGIAFEASDRHHPVPRRRGLSGGGWPGGLRAAFLPRTPDVTRRPVLATQLGEDQEGNPVSDRQRRGREWYPGKQPTQHAGRRLVRTGSVAEWNLHRRPCAPRKRWLAKWGMSHSHRRAGRSRRRASNTSSVNSSTASISSTNPIPNIWMPSIRVRAVRSIKCLVSRGPGRLA